MQSVDILCGGLNFGMEGNQGRIMAEEMKMETEEILKKLYEKEAATKGKFLEDVSYIHENVQQGKFSRRDYLCDDLYKYLGKVDLGSGKAPMPGQCVVLNGEDLDADFLTLNEILSLENAPLGKWSSQDANTVWQQIDVNLSVAKGKGETFEEVGKFVAAKEKTEAEKVAVLKELLVSNVVDRAVLLANYDKPDDAFESFKFYHGGETNNAYAEYPSRWYMLRNDALNDYSMMLSSDDGVALERLCKDLKDQSKTPGRLAATLGNEAERKAFYEKTLLPAVEEFRKADLTGDRLPKYAKAREAFLAQLKVVQDMQTKLGELQKAYLKNYDDEKLGQKNLKDAEATIEHCKRDAENAENAKKPLMEQRDKQNADYEELLKHLEEVSTAAKEAKDEWTKYNDVIRTGFDKERELRASVNPMMKLFQKKKYDAIMEQADQCSKDAIEAQEKAPAAEKKMKELNGQYDELMEIQRKIQDSQATVTDRISQLTKTINTAKKQMTLKEEDRQQAQFHLEAVKKEREKLLEQWSKEQGEDQRVLLDLNFVKELLAKDPKISGKRAIENPWFTKKYQKEREKLFSLAVEFQQAFVGASECCNANLATLSQIWGYWKRGNAKIDFHQADREETSPILWQTLFLFVPMIAVDLPNVGELFVDVKKPGSIGMLALDNADATAPQKMIGAIYRSRKAVAFPK